MSADKISANTATKGKIAEFHSVSSKIDYSGDEDWFKVKLKRGQIYEFTLQGPGTGKGTLQDPDLNIFNASGLPAQNVEGYPDSFGNVHLLIQATASGNYFIDAFSDGIGTGTYKLKFDRLDIAGDQEGSLDGTDTEGKISVGQTKKGHLIVPGDDDWYAINLKANTSYAFEVKYPIPFFGNAFDLTLRDATGNDLGATTVNNGPLTTVYYETGNSGGKFFLDVGSSSSNFAGYYALTAGYGSPPPP